MEATDGERADGEKNDGEYRPSPSQPIATFSPFTRTPLYSALSADPLVPPSALAAWTAASHLKKSANPVSNVSASPCTATATAMVQPSTSSHHCLCVLLCSFYGRSRHPLPTLALC